MGENKPLTQSEVDLLISQMASKSAPPPRSETRKANVSATSSQPVEHVVNTPSVVPPVMPTVRTLPENNIPPVVQARPPEASAVEVSNLQTGMNDLSKRLGQIEATVIRLEKLENVVNANVNNNNSNQVSSQQLQELMKRVQDLGKEVKTISAKLQGTLGYDIYHTFTCDKCSSKSLVSTAFKCTKCGQISWRGWMPRK